MSKLTNQTVYICDECEVEEREESLPAGWMELKPTTEHPSRYSDQTHYCDNCAIPIEAAEKEA